MQQAATEKRQNAPKPFEVSQVVRQRHPRIEMLLFCVSHNWAEVCTKNVDGLFRLSMLAWRPLLFHYEVSGLHSVQICHQQNWTQRFGSQVRNTSDEQLVSPPLNRGDTKEPQQVTNADWEVAYPELTQQQ